MKNWKRLTAAALAAAMLLSLCAGCQNGAGKPLPEKTPQNVRPSIAETNHALLKDGASDYQIVLPEKATEVEKFAANELQHFIKEASGATLPVRTESGDPSGGKYLYVGNTAASVAAGVAPTYEQVQFNGFVIRVVEDDCYLRGYADYGTRNAVYEFLTYAFDYECYAADEIKLQKTKSANLLAFDLTVTPTFDWREVNYGEIIRNPEQCYRMRFNATEEIFVLGHQTHCSMDIVDPYVYDFRSQKYADWYAHKTWTRVSTGKESPVQLCYSNADMAEAYIENLLEMIKDSKAGAMLLGMEDNVEWCECSACTATTQKYGTAAAIVIPFLNKVQAAVDKWFAENRPGEQPTRMVMFAYYATVVPPAKYNTATGKYEPIDETMKLNPNSAIMFAPIKAEYDIPFSESDPTDVTGPHGQLLGWHSISDTLYAWTYSLLPASGLVFMDTVEVMRDNYRLLSDNGTMMLLDQTDHYQKKSSPAWGRAKGYIMSKLAWDNTLNVEELLTDFFANYFGEAGETMQALFDQQREWMTHVYTDLGAEGYIWDALVETKYWSYNQLQNYLAQIDQAYADIEPLQQSDPTRYAQLCDRILLESMQYRYLILMLYSTEYSADDLLDMRTEFRVDFERLNLTAQSEGGDINELWAQWGLE